MSWIEEQERVLSIENIQQKEPLKTIKCHFFYITKQQYIYKIDIEELSIIENTELAINNIASIPSKKLIQIVQSKKIHTTNTKYVFEYLYLFHIDLEPKHIQEYVESDNDFSAKFFRRIPITNDLTIEPAIFVFHPITSLYFFFQEIDAPNQKDNRAKPILKSTQNQPQNNKKKVTLKILPNNIHRKTRRYMMVP